MIPEGITEAVQDTILGVVTDRGLPEKSHASVLGALRAPRRVLSDDQSTSFISLTLQAFRSVTSADPMGVVPAMASMEILLATCDVIDDVEDGDWDPGSDRRAIGMALETASNMMMMCHLVMLQGCDAGVSDRRVVGALKGQHLDMEFEGNTDVHFAASLAITEMKSASLGRCAAEVGARLGTDDHQKIQELGDFGWHMGLSMQLLNDVDGVWPGMAGRLAAAL